MEALEILPGLLATPFGGLVYKGHVIIADLHLGFEEEMSRKGVYLPPAQLKKALEVLKLSLKISNKVIIAGDLKHLFSKLGRMEQRDVLRFLDAAEEMGAELILVRGNHDNFVRHLLQERGFDVVNELDIGEIKVVHGHEDVEPGEITVMGHEHPSLALRDPIGATAKFPCFLKVPHERGYLVVLPAVGLYQTGTNVSLIKESYLSPIIKKYAKLEEAVPYVADEELGVVEFPPLGMMTDVLVSE
ncbi:phosphoesterase [Ignicoccus pacificus DSM 13166]|uniref:Phosphoesterase n=1 Tax=Ignicoccus pacificus DSM 13166 TaxID=940294 RepID=A0A977K9U2_9CREN|nr:phosphoesterase [Ignicoccus pacificus DSM 13166]